MPVSWARPTPRSTAVAANHTAREVVSIPHHDGWRIADYLRASFAAHAASVQRAQIRPAQLQPVCRMAHQVGLDQQLGYCACFVSVGTGSTQQRRSKIVQFASREP